MPRPRNAKAVLQVKEYRERGLTFRQIATLLKQDIRQIYRWYTYSQEKVIHN